MSAADLVLSKHLVGRGGRLFAAAAALALLRVAPSAADQPPEPFAVDEYARENDVGRDVAARRLELQARAAGLTDALERRLGRAFAGVWFDNEEGEFVVPVLSGRDAAVAATEFDDRGFAAKDYRTTIVESSLGELEAAQARMAPAIAGLLKKGRARAGLDTSRNRVVVEIAADAAAEARAGVRAQAAADPVAVKVVEADPGSFDAEAAALCEWKWRSCVPPLRGGVEIFRWLNPTEVEQCTAGFMTVGNQFGNKFVMTAGHCLIPAANWWAETNQGFEVQLGAPEGAYFAGGNADGGLIRVKDSNWWVQQWGWWGHVVAWGSWPNPAAVQYPSWTIKGSQPSYVGEFICHSGRTTGTNCGTVKQLGVKVTYSGGEELSNMTKVEGVCADHGDSGGPAWESASNAVGIWSGGENGTCGTQYYTEVREIESVFGVHVLAG